MKDLKKALLEILDMQLPFEIETGAMIYRTLKDRIKLLSDGKNSLVIQVPDESDGTNHEVELHTKGGFAICDCEESNATGECAHPSTAVFYALIDKLGINPSTIEDLFEEDIQLRNAANPIDAPVTAKPTEPSWMLPPGWKAITASPQMLRAEIETQSRGMYNRNEYYMRQTVRIKAFNEQQLIWTFSVTENKTELNPAISFNRHETYLYQCTCKQASGMCAHVKVAFAETLENDPIFFLKHKDWSTEKATFLAPFGVSLSDPNAKLFEFFISRYGVLSMKQPSFFWKKGDTQNFMRFKDMLSPGKAGAAVVNKPALIDFQLGFLLNLSSKRFANSFELEGLKVTDKKGKPVVNKLNLYQPANQALLRYLPAAISGALEAIGEDALKKRALREGYTGYISSIVQLAPDKIAMLENFYFEQLHILWKWLMQQPVYILREGKFVAGNYHPAVLSATLAKPCFSIVLEDQYMNLNILLEVEGKYVPFNQFVFHDNMLLEIDEVFYLPSAEDRKILMEFNKGFIRMHESDKHSLVRNIIPHLQKHYHVDIPEALHVKTEAIVPKKQLLLKEYGDSYLMLQPQFDYDGNIVDYEEQPEDIFQLGTDGSLQVIQREEATEAAFFESLRVLHPAFERQRFNTFFFVPFADVMKDGWFLKMLAMLQEQGIPVMGMKDLKKFKYNTNKPKWEMKAGSGIDWFDLEVEISFGDQVVSLPDIRKAVISGQNVVLLGDGSLGMLPEEWLKQYGLLLKMGETQKDGTLRISKMHYTLIDELHDQIDDEKVLQEIAAKKQKLNSIGDIKTIKPSKQVKAIHRPYQLSGFQWMQVLDEIGWGGCLADDMGLGKTLQAITFFQYLKEKYVGSTQLVVCPTSLIYNWDAELKKFGPALRYHIYYGSDRDFSDEHFENYDLVLTSYGVLRLDIEHLMKFEWRYVVLDESQAIKNPDAQITKALQLIKSRNRLILSGTPVQNNTYDLYAQFNFINPGLLGSRDFFKSEFANPIDKENDAEKGNRLRRLVYPFLLRRTKEQVAPDLPDKTEMILWCDMPKDQRAVYDHYKLYYRKMLSEKIAQEGMAKAGMYVLEGLLRLRQICDSPQLLKAKDVKTVTSIKTQELLRELRENTGQHKILVFSQFTEMLAIIRKNLESENIAYCYLDGATPAVKRNEAVQQFQTDPTYKVFLISLKAGGVGLNLTAADYVYIVDPWWNPAVEQQAIDRTHRIGQSQKIFAYRMICKDSVEEKIMQLQSRKKQLANDLITEDAGFIKKLGKEDIDFLFS